MDYEKKYKEALGKAEEFYNDKDNIRYANVEGMLEEIFPELKVSEDEKIVNAIRKALESKIEDLGNGVTRTACIAWLEKQAKQKPAWSEEDEKEYKYVLKFVDNILNNCGNKKDYERCKRCYDWLKSIKQKIKRE